MGNTMISFYNVKLSDWTQMGVHAFKKVCRDHNIRFRYHGGYYFTVAVPSNKMYLIKHYCNKIEECDENLIQ